MERLRPRHWELLLRWRGPGWVGRDGLPARHGRNPGCAARRPVCPELGQHVRLEQLLRAAPARDDRGLSQSVQYPVSRRDRGVQWPVILRLVARRSSYSGRVLVPQGRSIHRVQWHTRATRSQPPFRWGANLSQLSGLHRRRAPKWLSVRRRDHPLTSTSLLLALSLSPWRELGRA